MQIFAIFIILSESLGDADPISHLLTSTLAKNFLQRTALIVKGLYFVQSRELFYLFVD